MQDTDHTAKPFSLDYMRQIIWEMKLPTTAFPVLWGSNRFVDEIAQETLLPI